VFPLLAAECHRSLLLVLPKNESIRETPRPCMRKLSQYSWSVPGTCRAKRCEGHSSYFTVQCARGCTVFWFLINGHRK
jgi:hypothetical protein